MGFLFGLCGVVGVLLLSLIVLMSDKHELNNTLLESVWG